ncbi:hypothetical protein [Mycolicibacterium mageritense]|uniref:hypothetical protein n=1 Tax=Mycolicibacterium mageritense TaxID=53462 RepID=UPI001E3C34CF|nr:hypothetical protein [Mycolicibacterium mageritense]GJJ24105.1 hypothetical protein MTY414_77790 [Mycolicibacterium mageritense]
MKARRCHRPPPSGDACLCCRGRGVLPTAEVNGQPLGPTAVDGNTILQCCEKCVAALFFGGTHPHEIDLAGLHDRGLG